MLSTDIVSEIIIEYKNSCAINKMFYYTSLCRFVYSHYIKYNDIFKTNINNLDLNVIMDRFDKNIILIDTQIYNNCENLITFLEKNDAKINNETFCYKIFQNKTYAMFDKILEPFEEVVKNRIDPERSFFLSYNFVLCKFYGNY